MKNIGILHAAFVSAVVLAGCNSMPAGDSPLAQAHNDYRAAQADPQVPALAAGELKQASDSLDKADNAAKKGEKSEVVDHLAYLAKQQVATAWETARQKTAEMAVVSAGAERDRIRLEARTREADRAQLNAATAQRSAEASQRQSEASQRSAEASQRQAEASQRAAEASQRQAVVEKQAANDAQMSAQAARAQTQEAESRSMRLEGQLRDMQAQKTDRGMVVTLGDVLFDTNQAQLKSGGMRSLQKLADFFKEYPQRTVMIEGFTDSTGGAARNQELSSDRASSVRTALIGMGVGTDRMSSRGYGESFPVAANDTLAGRQLNRRVEIVVSDASGKIAPR